MGQLLPARIKGAPAYYSSERCFEDWKLISASTRKRRFPLDWEPPFVLQPFLRD